MSTRAYYNQKLDIIVRLNITLNEFVIIGDDTKVSDQTLIDMMRGTLVPDGWVAI